MKNLLFLILFIPAFATAQINGTIQKTVATKVIRGNFGSSGLDSLVSYTGALTDDYILQWDNTLKKAVWVSMAASVDTTVYRTVANSVSLAGLQTRLNTKASLTGASFSGNVAFGTGSTTVIDGSNGRLILDKIRVYNSIPATQYHDFVSGATSNYTISIPNFGGEMILGAGAQTIPGIKTFSGGLISSSGTTLTGTGVANSLQSTNNSYTTEIRTTGTVGYIGTESNGLILAPSNATKTLEILSNNTLRSSSFGLSGNVIVGADNNGTMGKIAVGSGLSLSGGILTATGGSSGSVTTAGGTSGRIAKFTSASNIENSIITEAINNISINGADGTNQLDLLSGGNGRMSIGYISSLMQIYSQNLLPLRLGVGAGTTGLTISSGDGAEFSTTGVPVNISSTNSNTFKAALKDGASIRGYLGASSTDAFVVGSSAAATLMTVNNSTGAVTASSFVGALSGNATTATALQTARTISGTSFDGTGNITLNNTGITNGAGYITASSTNTLTNKSGNISQWTNDTGYAIGSFTGYATLANPAFTGTPTAPTATDGTNTTQIATTAFVQSAASSGSYTPGLTNETNITSSSVIGSATYSKVGNIVHVSLTVNITPTASATNTVLYFALPSGLNAAVSSGSGVSVASQGGPSGVVQYQSSTGGKVTFVSSSTSVLTHYIQFDYSL